MRITTDGRIKGTPPIPVPDGMQVMTRREAAGALGVDQRVITRYAQRGALVKYVTVSDAFGRPGAVVFDAEAVRTLATLRRPTESPAEPVQPERRRW